MVFRRKSDAARDLAHAAFGKGARILVVRLDSVGDCILASGFFAGLRGRFPEAYISAVLRQETAQLYEDSALFDEIVTVPDGGVWSADILQPPYDLAICPRWDVDYWGARELALLSGAPVRVGFDRRGYFYDEDHDGQAERYFTHLATTEGAQHEALKGRDLLAYFGAADFYETPRLFLTSGDRAEADEFRRRHGLERYATLGISARLPNRIWPVSNFLPVVDALHVKHALKFAVVAGPEGMEAGGWLASQRPDCVVSAAGNLKLRTAAALIGGAELHIGMNSGPIHIAAASGVPVVEISAHPLGGRDDHHIAPNRFGAFGVPGIALRPRRAGFRCRRGCIVTEHPHCILSVSAEDVVSAAEKLLRTDS